MNSRLKHYRITALALAIATMCASSNLAEGSELDPKTWCSKVSDLVAAKQVQRVPAMAVEASRGEITPKAAEGFLAISPVTEAGEVRTNALLIEKNYNNAMSKIWHLIVFGNTSLYLRCTFVNVENGWMLFDLTFNTDEAEIGLP